MPPSKHWTVVRTPEAAYALIRDAQSRGQEMVLSLDHDLGEDIPTGYDLLNWLEKDIVTEQNFCPKISFQIHSANPVGRDNMARAIRAIEGMM
jgi:hypothetical protein